MNNFEIPIDAYITEFRKHVLANPRTILSSKFGDGKSYFLEKFKRETSDDFVFITIYPVNYQVISNEDIFNIIKRDVLFQLLEHKIITDSIELDKKVVLWGFLQNNCKPFLEDLLPYLAKTALPFEFVPEVLKALKELFSSFNESLKEYSNRLNCRDEALAAFLDGQNNNFLYEEDFVTTIIKTSISEYKKANANKRIVLLVEDLDRLDPHHLFRILNVFSAHIDYSYKYFSQPDTSLVGNKFGFDNVVLVADFSNIRKIFRHFYGEQTDFNGYIGKFLSSVPYQYSIRQICAQYIHAYIANRFKFPRNVIEKLLPPDIFESKTIRECVNGLNIHSQIFEEPVYHCGKVKTKLDTTFLKIMSVMHRLKIEDGEIIKICSPLFSYDKTTFCRYVAPYMLLDGTDNNLEIKIYRREKSDANINRVIVNVNPDTGQGKISDDSYYLNNHEQTDITTVYSRMLKFLAK